MLAKQKVNSGSNETGIASSLSRRNFFLSAAAVSGLALSQGAARPAMVNTDVANLPPYGNSTLPPGIRSRMVNNINGLAIHILEAGFEVPDRPAVLLLHGFPELCYSWRKVMLPLSAAGYHVIASDTRGYGRTTGWDDSYEATDLFTNLTMVRDAIGLVFALGHRSVAAVVGHDAGSPDAAWCSLVRPDVFRSVAMLSTPIAGPPVMPFNTANERPTGAGQSGPSNNLSAQLAALQPPRKYYQDYFRERGANDNMRNAPQGLHDFLRAYFHYKSADWKQNKPYRLRSASADELAKLPTYYVMDLDKGMAETVAAEMPSASEIAACKWLTEAELSVYVSEYSRTGFQGALQNYLRIVNLKNVAQNQIFSGRTIDVPSCFIAGESDWGIYQTPGAIERLQNSVCTQMRGVQLVEGAGHWVQQEQPEQVSDLLIRFLQGNPWPRT
jgi:pimeloyl-ACP methyl ester carboxylesterase